ncbi:hypothetical protein B0H16DRAFT_1849214 [Mycena metata]|uniref:Uncharacterized protein n=1 Tax=Mycena metata TaxID=1033252 RepID=A0AAD7IQH5_9AGAR|nr:hypothetical protein B0H16DRAFT_1849214 [Mycena metata]
MRPPMTSASAPACTSTACLPAAIPANSMRAVYASSLRSMAVVGSCRPHHVSRRRASPRTPRLPRVNLPFARPPLTRTPAMPSRPHCLSHLYPTAIPLHVPFRPPSLALPSIPRLARVVLVNIACAPRPPFPAYFAHTPIDLAPMAPSVSHVWSRCFPSHVRILFPVYRGFDPEASVRGE